MFTRQKRLQAILGYFTKKTHKIFRCPDGGSWVRFFLSLTPVSPVVPSARVTQSLDIQYIQSTCLLSGLDMMGSVAMETVIFVAVW